MPALLMTPSRNLSVHDTGAPEGESSYTTLIFLHGYIWHSGTFARLLPFAKQYRVRMVLVNRRDYPGATTCSEEDLSNLKSASQDTTPEAANLLREFCKVRARELHEWLQGFIELEGISKAGGIIIIAWSLGVMFLHMLLTYAPTFPPISGGVDVAAYIKCAVAFDNGMGYPPPPPIYYHPLFDTSLAPAVRMNVFSTWISGYFKHGETPSDIEFRTPLSTPPSTVSTMSEDEVSSAKHAPPSNPGGSEEMLIRASRQHLLHAKLRKAVLFPAIVDDGWSKVRWRMIWADHSVGEIVWSKWALEAEIEGAKKAGQYVRPVEIVRLRGANHFAPWDLPEQFLRAVLDPVDEK